MTTKTPLKQENPPSEEEIQKALEKLMRGPVKEFPPLKDGATDEEFVEWLQGDIWDEHQGHDPCRGRYMYSRERRKITNEELNRVCRAIEALGLIVEPVNACMGFNFGVSIYMGEDPETEAFARGHGLKLSCRFVLSITGDHLDTRFEETWKLLSPLSHNQKNVARLLRYGFERPRDKFYYDY